MVYIIIHRSYRWHTPPQQLLWQAAEVHEIWCNFFSPGHGPSKNYLRSSTDVYSIGISYVYCIIFITIIYTHNGGGLRTEAARKNKSPPRIESNSIRYALSVASVDQPKHTNAMYIYIYVYPLLVARYKCNNVGIKYLKNIVASNLQTYYYNVHIGWWPPTTNVECIASVSIKSNCI